MNALINQRTRNQVILEACNIPALPGTNNYTYYDNDVVEKLELIKEAKAIGFTLAEIKVLIDAWHSRRLSPEKKIEVLLKKIDEIDEKFTHMKQMKKMLRDGIRDVENGEC